MMCYTAAGQQGVVSSRCAEMLQSPSNSGEEDQRRLISHRGQTVELDLLLFWSLS